ncbi:MAG: MBOAT family O-acyltransferase [Syntrophobacteraceae bacterium]|jgi:alginate O-acetyltransferase complex protein AlgI
MLFSSVIFLFFFLPVVLTLYLLPSQRWRSFLFLLASFVFYAWSQGGYILALLVSIFFNYLFGLWIGRLDGAVRTLSGRIHTRKAVLIFGLVFNLLLLTMLKYANFLSMNVNVLLSWLSLPHVQISQIYAPLGISFFTFHAISYLVDIYRGEGPVQRNPGALAIYLAAFPKVLAGPIAQYRQAAHQLDRRLITVPDLAYGIERFVTGLAKKVLLANPLGAVADAAFGLQPENLAPYSAWAGILCYTLQIYFDFSGYSDMAIGLGRMFGFEFPENFNFPYISQSVREFWRRWHISLSLWFRNYLYIPLGGNRLSQARTCFNLVFVFLLCGLWHGASWTFIIWGAWYGLFLLLERTWFGTLIERAPRALRHFYLLAVVVTGWVFFRADSMGFAITYLKSMLGVHWGSGRTGQFAIHLNNEIVTLFAVAVFFCLPVSSWLKRLCTPAPVGLASFYDFRRTGFYVSYALILSLVFFASILSLAGGTHKAFIYFRF